MPEYRRSNVLGAIYFFTLVTHRRRLLLTSDAARALLKDVFRRVQAKRPFIVEGFVLLPDHIHTLWRLPEGDADFSMRWSEIKGIFTRECLGKVIDDPIPPSSSRLRRRERGVWQRRYWEHLIRGEDDFCRHLDYIHYNPIKHGYVQRAREWLWSSFHRYVEIGWYDAEWGDCALEDLPDACMEEPDG